MDSRKDSANTDGRITVTLKKDMGNHGSSSGFSVGSGNCDRCIVVPHDLSQKLCTGEHWKPFFFRTGKFRVVRVDRCCIDNHIYIILDVGSALSVIDHSATFFQCVGQRAGFGIGTGNPEIFFQKDLGKAAHADASDPDEMNMERFMKVYLIHNNLLIYMLFS